MNQTSNHPDTPETSASTPQPGDPRYNFAIATSAVGDLMSGVTTDQTSLATPCPEFTVKELLEHLVLVMRRTAAMGRGEHWSTITEDPVDAGWHDQYREAAHAVMDAWADPAKLDGTYEVPWGEVPGVALMITYTGELATHGWDLATAIGVDFEVDDDALRPALQGAQMMMPSGIRDEEFVPFGPVVKVDSDASVLTQLAGWLGRDVN